MNFLTTPQLCEVAGITKKQVDWWNRHEVIHAYRNQGPGHPLSFRFTPWDAVAARVVNAFMPTHALRCFRGLGHAIHVTEIPCDDLLVVVDADKFTLTTIDNIGERPKPSCRVHICGPEFTHVHDAMADLGLVCPF